VKRPSSYAEQAEAIAAFGARVERLEELQRLYHAGQLSEKELGRAIQSAKEATELDRKILGEAKAAALGPFDAKQYEHLQAALEERWRQLVYLRRQYNDPNNEEAFKAMVEAFAEFSALFWLLEPWRQAVAEEVEAFPGMIEAERQAALKAAGFRVPTERRPPRKKPTPAELREKAFLLLGEANKQRAKNGQR